MKINPEWRSLGWRHPMWDILRFYLSLSANGKHRADWLEKLASTGQLSVEAGRAFAISPNDIELLIRYIAQRDEYSEEAAQLLRTEQAALKFCQQARLNVDRTRTKNADHHQSSKALVAAVNGIAASVCGSANIGLHANPSRRCIWCSDSGLHVSARNVDGVIPSLANPTIIWEIKEYWGKTKGGSKMSDAVYECHLVGRELREFEEERDTRVSHLVFLDGQQQWSARMSDLRRFIDLMNRGLIDRLFVGTDVETEWESVLKELLPQSPDC